MRYTRLALLARYDTHRAIAAEILHGLEGHGHRTGKRHGVQCQREKSISIEHKDLFRVAFFQRQTDASARAERRLLHGKIVAERPGVRLDKGHHLLL